DAHNTPLMTGRRYRRKSGGGKLVWNALCLLLTGGLVAGGIYGAKYLQENQVKPEPATDPAKLVERLGAPAARDNAMKALREQGAKAEEALRAGAKSGNPDVAKRCEELLAALGGTDGSNSGGGAGGGAVAKGPFPRRLLFIHISKYMYLNPL